MEKESRQSKEGGSIDNDLIKGRFARLKEKVLMGIATRINKLQINEYLDRTADPRGQHKQPLSPEAHEAGLQDQFQERVAQTAEKVNPEIRTLTELNSEVVHTQRIIRQLLDEIHIARKRAQRAKTAKAVDNLPIPFFISIIGIINGPLLKKSLKKIEELHTRLTDPGSKLNKYLHADQVQYMKAHGYHTATSTLSWVLAAPTGGLSLIPAVYTYFKGLTSSIKGFKAETITLDQLDNLERSLATFYNNITDMPDKIAQHKADYCRQVSENIEAGTTAR